ncbi:hypothetical protein P280DRAFT_551095 [Massarina eburnea CBS 473.64]|uniref:Extracellular membrane protein CFEM domain-containing protein n=1 Tax=Massarina eburnea CBS 473.64 TaxID=1395130 RepID=A0A6A6RV51_9PLEO|nr:hypothetical protein P280DRAFT_551095 [Massarina eburnea CBS 473.64]
MHFNAIIYTVLMASYASANPQTDDDSSDSSSITSSASLACATGETRTKYESCSSSISSEIDKCKDNDLVCACHLANSGFECLTSYCPTHTSAICQGSLVLQGLCGLAGATVPTLTHLSCPSSILDLLASLIPSNVASFLPSDINTRLPSNIPFWNGGDAFGIPQETAGTPGSPGSTTGTVKGSGTESPSAPKQTGGAGKGRVGTGKMGAGLLGFLGVGVMVSVGIIGGLAAWL